MNILTRAVLRLRHLLSLPDTVREMNGRIDGLQRAVGRLELYNSRASSSPSLKSHEFQVYSQWGEDGIIQFLVDTIKITNPVFVEFGVGNYLESNTRFLLHHNSWSGLVIDSSSDDIAAIHLDPIYWKYNLKAECAFIDRDNINNLISKHGISGEIGLLSIDIDGNDYWIWDVITVIQPQIVICEYNSLFGDRAPVTVPYDRTFSRYATHLSGAYYGASLAALHHLAGEKGYSLVGTNSGGINAFFVRNDLMANLENLTPQQAFTPATFRDSRNTGGALTFLERSQRYAQIADLALYDVVNRQATTLREWTVSVAEIDRSPMSRSTSD